jgi:hypothetical protein
VALRISAFSSKDIQATILAMKGMDRELAKQVRRATKEMIQSEWQRALAEESMSRMEVRVLANTGRAAVSDQNVVLSSATVGKSLAGGAKPSEIYHNVEFGADRSFARTYTATSKKGTSYKVRRRTRSQFRPRNMKGYVVYPAAARVIPRLAALWVQTTVRTFYEQFEGR